MITLYHGEDVTSSRRALPENAVKIEGKDATSELLTQLLEGGSLFGEKRAVVIENVKKLPENISGDLILWFDHKLTPSQLQPYAGAKVTEFKLNQTVFQFLESIWPGNQKVMLPLFEKYCQQEFPEIAFVMIVRQFRLMLNPTGLPTWQKNRIVAQTKKFSSGRIREVYRQLLQLDYNQKSGQATLDLKGSLELFLLSL